MIGWEDEVGSDTSSLNKETPSIGSHLQTSLRVLMAFWLKITFI